jgi:uncharacterized protein (DUF2237 family)
LKVFNTGPSGCNLVSSKFKNEEKCIKNDLKHTKYVDGGKRLLPKPGDCWNLCPGRTV